MTDPKTPRPIPNTIEIQTFLHCGLCIRELPRGTSPRDWARCQAGWTVLGLQVICTRHDVNVLHIDFEGQVHPGNTSRPLTDTEKQTRKEKEN